MKVYIKKFKNALRGKQLTHFLHIDKTGGTTIEYALKRSPLTKVKR